MKYLIDFMFLTLLYICVFFRKWKRKSNDVLFINTLMYIYLSFVLYFTLMPMITSIPFILNHSYAPMNLVPFIDVSKERGDFLRQIILNVIMTMPFGFLFPITQNRKGSFSKTILWVFLMSLGIEILQPMISDVRASDITDIITNVMGGIIGYIFYVVFKPMIFWILDYLKIKTSKI